MSVTKEQAELFWTAAENVSCDDADMISPCDAIQAIGIAGEVLDESQKEIDSLTELLTDMHKARLTESASYPNSPLEAHVLDALGLEQRN